MLLDVVSRTGDGVTKVHSELVVDVPGSTFPSVGRASCAILLSSAVSVTQLDMVSERSQRPCRLIEDTSVHDWLETLEYALRKVPLCHTRVANL